MLISLIIPVYNTKDYLNACLDSILAQESDDFEVILIDDGSNDGSSDLCDLFCEKISGKQGKVRAKVIHQDNQGLSSARNRGIEEAEGEWLWFIDSDDYIPSDALLTIKERMSGARGDLYAFQYIKTDEDGKNEEYIFFRAHQEYLRLKDEGSTVWYYCERLLNYTDGWEVHTRLYNREIIVDNNIRFTDNKKVFAEDLCFLTEYLMFVKEAVLLVNYLYYYRQRDNSIMHTLDQHSVIPRLTNLLENVYLKAKVSKKRFICKSFSGVCLALFSDHIKNKLDEISDDEICNELIESTNNKAIGKYIKKAFGKLEEVARGERRRK